MSESEKLTYQERLTGAVWRVIEELGGYIDDRAMEQLDEALSDIASHSASQDPEEDDPEEGSPLSSIPSDLQRNPDRDE